MDGTHTGKLSAESVRAALRRVRGSALNFVPRDCEAEARPADETAEAEQGQRSAFCKTAATGAAKAGNRNHQGEGISVLRSRQKWVPPGRRRFCDTRRSIYTAPSSMLSCQGNHQRRYAMQYDAAPMEGLTDRVWRQAHQRWFGGADRYYAPFLSPPENRIPVKKKMAELAPAANPGAPVIPQLLGKDGSCAAWMIGVLREMGYTEVNLNFGCPSGTVTAKGKGAGMLRDLDALDRFLDAVFTEAGGPISVKTRIGVERPEEFGPILEVYNRYPLAGLIVHPRVMRQLYRGQADR